MLDVDTLEIASTRPAQFYALRWLLWVNRGDDKRIARLATVDASLGYGRPSETAVRASKRSARSVWNVFSEGGPRPTGRAEPLAPIRNDGDGLDVLAPKFREEPMLETVRHGSGCQLSHKPEEVGRDTDMVGLGADGVLLPSERCRQERSDVDFCAVERAAKTLRRPAGLARRQVLTEPENERHDRTGVDRDRFSSEDRCLPLQLRHSVDAVEIHRCRHPAVDDHLKSQTSGHKTPLERNCRFKVGVSVHDLLPPAFGYL